MDAIAGEDGWLRCPWALSALEYRDYHDLEWGQPVTTSQGLYERLTLEAFQSGLSWITILRKRDNFRAAFAGFDPDVVASFDGGDVERLMSDAGIVRNRTKIDAAINNAKVVAGLGPGFADLVLSFAVADRPRPSSLAEVPASTAESINLAKTLKSLGVRFVGPTTAYALMQAVGLVDDHLTECFVQIDRRGLPGS
ncbi:MAG: DNA-3-methyladenine glycosylase [uncultured Propionibacteriaceae bacterium]|uniref:DNA-3-methyladenine glycosylase n=1 Tax=uncultured Propionibacteriaceae bacterium TaxID=257457 RepID=A0A6J4N0B1_9ACTN|nr:MAG: DNA-3-methyladenine glycosylase [uncultured Propionibacteriaceae bacterium]